MNALTWLHFAGGSAALLAGAVAFAARKGGRVHAAAGTGFVAAMLLLGVTATILARLQEVPESGAGGLFVGYFVLTAWVAARRRDGSTGRFEMLAAALALGTAALMAWGGLTGATTPAGAGPVFVLAGFCLFAGLGDLRAVLRGRLTPAQRLVRHSWRMCFAAFIATGSFFLGQQDVMPAAVRGSPFLFVLAFAPFALMLFWLVRLRFARAIARSARSGLIYIGRQPQPHA